MKNIFKLCAIINFCACLTAFSQMPHDAIYMPRRSTCAALTYSTSSWSEYWENTLKRENLNMGTHTTQSIMPMVAIGLTEKVNIIVAVPYITTKTSAGNLMGQKGIQDLSAWLKYKLVANGKGLSLHGIIGASIPASSYVPDFLPMSIGLQTKTATARFLGNYHHSNGLYLTAHASYTLRSNITVDRDAYQADNKIYNSNEVRVPNATDIAARAGYLKGALQVEGFIERFTCVGGDNIRRNDMPFPTNNMQMTTAGIYGKFQPKNLGVNLRAGKVLSGLNVGQALSFSVGLLYQLNYFKKEEKK